MMDLVCEDNRFEFNFYGNVRDNSLFEYASQLNCERIKFFGPYLPQEKEKILKGVDILFNMYGNGSLLVKYALSNKLYDSFYYKKPLITSPNTEMSKLANCFSFDVDFDTENLDGLFEWYKNIDVKQADKVVQEFAIRVEQDKKDFEKALQLIVTSK